MKTFQNISKLKKTVSGSNRLSPHLLSVSIAIATLSTTFTTEASPWLETHDPFLRSDLLALSDAGLLNSPVNHYPLRWSMIGDELDIVHQNNQNQVSNELERAASHLHYALASAEYGRGNRALKAVCGSETPVASGFGQYSKNEWGATASYESMRNSFAFRVTTGYAKYGEDEDFLWNDSYLALNAGKWLFSVGSIDRWWGQGWQHNLILGSFARSNPDLSVSYIGSNTILGNWGAEAIIGLPDDASTDKPSTNKHSAFRLASKPVSFFEYGLTYQSWFDGSEFSDGDKQTSLDAKLTLPAFDKIYHSVYGELASSANSFEPVAWLLGWSGQFDFAGQTIRLVLEKQDSTSEKDPQSWENNQYPSYSDGAAKTTYELDNSISAALYLQLQNDHSLSLIAQESEQNNKTVKTLQVSYRLPALAGMLHFGAGRTDNETNKDETNIWTGYEFRF
ncbi:hypothetical protein DI392_05505 [Vibrio albus]|uniref:Capsule assembly Wzi family protein n=1 Tax=Vibrio albus TaxID=2200953 RepID=A0A2U3BCS8_9VIBR|nr:capsule assembly Wzi family protein [Vibrio albus]PWI34563.1 hypothetical protein DI392_05505 [Vibrio albus]